MDEKTEILIRELAEKLGTTGEHWWTALVQQAPITGAIHLMLTTAALLVLGRSYRMLRNGRIGSEFWVPWAGAACIVIMILTMTLHETIGALVNPEYWALMKVLSVVK